MYGNRIQLRNKHLNVTLIVAITFVIVIIVIVIAYNTIPLLPQYYEGRFINKLQNDIILLILNI